MYCDGCHQGTDGCNTMHIAMGVLVKVHRCSVSGDTHRDGCVGDTHCDGCVGDGIAIGVLVTRYTDGCVGDGQRWVCW